MHWRAHFNYAVGLQFWRSVGVSALIVIIAEGGPTGAYLVTIGEGRTVTVDTAARARLVVDTRRALPRPTADREAAQ